MMYLQRLFLKINKRTSRKDNMNITQLEEQIIKAVDQEINVAGKVGINDNDYYDPNIELEELKQFIKKCFEEHKKG